MNYKTFRNYYFINSILKIDGIGIQKTIQLLSSFEDLDFIANSNIESITTIQGISPTQASQLLKINSDENFIKSEFDKYASFLEKNNTGLITYLDKDYPYLLKNIYSPPLYLFIKGEITKTDLSAVAIVGTRLPSAYGKIQAEYFASALSKNNVTVISGMARGIDTIAHRNALQNGGRTIAVMGTGMDVIYPSENRNLFNSIIENGAVITEYDYETKPDAQNFPRRNRIISGLSLGTIVIETRINGGAMHTANYAIEQNRDVFAVPGNISSKLSEGTNQLIKENRAKLITNIDDVLYDLNIPKLKTTSDEKNIPELNFFEEKIYQILNDEPKQVDEISSLANINTSDCLVNLFGLEMKGVIRQLPGMFFIRN
ncbi:hypothetical protein APF79_06185 [bacterium BRH_c32]|nr:MAG: hypothetical protein APF79_06185 [bacterium BRH_c32]